MNFGITRMADIWQIHGGTRMTTIHEGRHGDTPAYLGNKFFINFVIVNLTIFLVIAGNQYFIVSIFFVSVIICQLTTMS